MDNDYSVEELDLPWADEEFIGKFVSAVNAPTYRESAENTRDLVNLVKSRMEEDLF